MQKRYKGIIIFIKIYKENDLFIKFLSDTDELISGIVYGGLSKKKKGIYQIGFFLNLNVSYISNKPPSISAELIKPFLSNIISNKFKISCLLSTISLINLSIVEGQKINNIFNLSENFFKLMITEKKWLIDYCIFLLNLLKIIGYEINFKEELNNKFFNLDTLGFVSEKTNPCIEFPFNLILKKDRSRLNYTSVNNIFRIFEKVFLYNHLSNLNLQLPNQYHLFKKLILKNLNDK